MTTVTSPIRHSYVTMGAYSRVYKMGEIEAAEAEDEDEVLYFGVDSASNGRKPRHVFNDFKHVMGHIARSRWASYVFESPSFLAGFPTTPPIEKPSHASLSSPSLPIPTAPQVNTPNDYIHVLAFRNRWVSISPRPSVPQPVNLKRQRAPKRTTSLVKTTTARVCASASASNTREQHDLYPNLHTFYTCYLLCCAPRPLSCLVRTRPPSLGLRSGME